MAKWTKNHMLEIGAVVAAIGLILTIISFTYSFADTTPGWLASYDGLVNRDEGNYNLILFIAGPIMLIIGGFYFGEQLVLRRRFERLLDTPRKSEFSTRRRDLEDLAKRLPDNFRQRIDAKESEFTSRRSA
jgi:hypothetical protein